MRTDNDSFALPPAIAAARLRAPRHLRKSRDRENNYIAENTVSHGKKKTNRKRAGAPSGNRNAVTHGAYTAEHRAFRAQVHRLIRAARETLALRKLAVALWGQRS
ncbi:MAG: hypothetical protein WDM86_05405 [Rhizomicrobium sp.]